MNLMQRSASWLGERLQAAAGRTVIISRGATTESVTAWVIEHGIHVDESGGVLTKYRKRVWGFVKSDLDGWEFLPGDLITDTETDEVDEVLPTDADSVRDSKSEDVDKLIAVHAKRIT